MSATSITAYGKVILTGEHSVVYGYPALVTRCGLSRTIDLKVGEEVDPFFKTVIGIFDKKYEQDSSQIKVLAGGDLPTGSGLGSSAAAAYGVFQALAKHYQLDLDLEEYLALVEINEEIAHGRASGVDANCVVRGGLLVFQKENGVTKLETIPAGSLAQETFYLVNSGRPTESTKEMVEMVTKDPEKNKKILKKIRDVSSQLIAGIRADNPDLSLFDQNGLLLEELGVVGAQAQKLSRLAREVGGYIKVTGAGGVESGSGMLMAYHPDSDLLNQLLKSAKIEFYPISVA